VLIIRRSKFYYTASDIITPVGDRTVRRLTEDCAPDGHLQLLRQILWVVKEIYQSTGKAEKKTREIKQKVI